MSVSEASAEAVGHLVAHRLLMHSSRHPMTGALSLDVLKVDIDGADCGIVRQWLRTEPLLRAKVLIVEAHPLPPPIQFEVSSVADSDSCRNLRGTANSCLMRIGLGLYGCSLS